MTFVKGSVRSHIRKKPSGGYTQVKKHSRNYVVNTTLTRQTFNTNTDYLADKLGDSSFFNNINKKRMSELMKERMKPTMYQDPLWRNLSQNKRSAELFNPNMSDPTIPIVFVDIDFASKRKGNRLNTEKFMELTTLRQQGIKFSSVPIYDLKTGVIEEGNHRVEWARMKGYKTIPVRVEGGWT